MNGSNYTRDEREELGLSGYYKVHCEVVSYYVISCECIMQTLGQPLKQVCVFFNKTDMPRKESFKVLIFS